jgi:hypothetical protein
MKANPGQGGAMNQILLLVLLGAAMVAVLVQLTRMLPRDGYGHRPPPRSHWDELGADRHEMV